VATSVVERSVAAGVITLSIAFVVVTIAHLVFGAWLVREHGPSALRDGAAFIREIPTTPRPPRPWRVPAGRRR
jgi:hypothetical protein